MVERILSVTVFLKVSGSIGIGKITQKRFFEGFGENPGILGALIALQ